jgi:hypothetical protein
VKHTDPALHGNVMSVSCTVVAPRGFFSLPHLTVTVTSDPLQKIKNIPYVILHVCQCYIIVRWEKGLFRTKALILQVWAIEWRRGIFYISYLVWIFRCYGAHIKHYIMNIGTTVETILENIQYILYKCTEQSLVNFVLGSMLSFIIKRKWQCWLFVKISSSFHIFIQ